MAFIETPACAKVAVEWTLFGRPIVNTLWFERADDDDYNTGTLEDLCGLLSTWLQAELLPQLSESIECVRLYATAQHSAFAPFFELPMGNVNGELTGGAMPTKVAMCIAFKSDVRGRSYRGRNYVAGIREADVADNAFGATRIAGVVAAYNALPAAVLNDNIWVIVSHYADNAPRSQGVSVGVQFAQSVNSAIDIQRRRD